MRTDSLTLTRPAEVLGSLLHLLHVRDSHGEREQLFPVEPRRLQSGRSRGTIVLVPDWADIPTDHEELRAKLDRAGFEVISLQNIGSVHSATGIDEVAEVADELITVARNVAPIAVIGHGSGVTSVLLALSRERVSQNAILIAADASTPDADLVRELGDVRSLFVHSNDDPITPFHDAIEIAQAWPNSILARFEGLGHRRIIRSQVTHEAVLRFLENETTVLH